jgi:hypothetical protein
VAAHHHFPDLNINITGTTISFYGTSPIYLGRPVSRQRVNLITTRPAGHRRAVITENLEAPQLEDSYLCISAP